MTSLTTPTPIALPDTFANWENEFQKRALFFADVCSVRGSNRVLMLPDLLKTLFKLSGDERLSADARQAFEKTAHKIIRGIEFLPDDDRSMIALMKDVDTVAKVIEAHITEIPAKVVSFRNESEELDLETLVKYLLYEPEYFATEC